jgi:hypothetical protein
MYAVVELIAPERAKALVAKMGRQRRLNVNRVQRYVRERKAGRWVLTHQGIAIDTEGFLRDGQHRLEMVIRSGMPTIFLVVYNVPPDSILHVDEQLPRSVRDALGMAEKGEFSNTTIATAGIIRRVPDSASTYATREEIMRDLRMFSQPLDFMEQHLRQGLGITRGVRALIVRAWYSVDRARLQDFCKILMDGMTVSPNADHDGAAVRYRNYIMTSKGSADSVELEKYRRGQYALEHFLRRQPLAKIYVNDKDVYPLPDIASLDLDNADESEAEA